MTNHTNNIPATDALPRSQPTLATTEVRELDALVPGFALRHVEDHFEERTANREDRAANRRRKDRLTDAIVCLCFAVSIALIINAVSGQPARPAITAVVALIGAVGFYSSRIAK